MTSDDRTPDPVETPPAEHRVRLRKEAMIFEQPRHAIGLLAAACTLVGVIVGFSMGLLANRTHCHATHVDAASAVAARAPAVAVDTAPGFLGVQIRSDLEEIGDPDGPTVLVRGARVVQVIPNTPAARVGLRAGDLITRVDAEAVTDMHVLMAKIRARAPTQEVAVGFYRNGERQTVRASLVPLPDSLR